MCMDIPIQMCFGVCIDMGTGTCADMCIDVCTDTCMHMCISMRIAKCTDMSVDSRPHMCMDMCVAMSVNMSADMCTGMCTGLCTGMGMRHTAEGKTLVTNGSYDQSTGHNYIGNNYIGHNYTGRNYIGHNYVGHDYIGHSDIGHNYMGSNRSPAGPIFAIAIDMPPILLFHVAGNTQKNSTTFRRMPTATAEGAEMESARGIGKVSTRRVFRHPSDRHGSSAVRRLAY